MHPPRLSHLAIIGSGSVAAHLVAELTVQAMAANVKLEFVDIPSSSPPYTPPPVPSLPPVLLKPLTEDVLHTFPTAAERRAPNQPFYSKFYKKNRRR